MMMKTGTVRSLWSGKLAATVAVQIAMAVGTTSMAAAASEQVLWSFTGGNDGATPQAGLFLPPAPSTTLYGATFSGGANGQGVVFSIPTTGGSPTILYSFQGTTDGAGPAGTPVLDTAVPSNILGTTAFANLNSKGVGSGYGSVYELVYNTVTGSYTFHNLHTFTIIPDGANPYAGLFLNSDNNGDYFGTAIQGGTGSCTIFELTKTAGLYSYAPIYSFGASSTDGQYPYGGVLCSGGTLYGTTTLGGSSYQGVVYRYVPILNFMTILRNFNNTNGGYPRSGLILVGSNVYGTANTGSASGDGNVFSVPSGGGTLVVQHAFTGSGTDGSYPWAGLISDSSGNFYGTTTTGGTYKSGTVYKLTGTTYTTLYSFTGGSDGSAPRAALVMDSRGNLYGTTTSGGANGQGVVFKDHAVSTTTRR